MSSTKPNACNLIEYACLLRWAWLNPSHKDAQDGVREFERRHTEALLPLWKQWQDREPNNVQQASPQVAATKRVTGLRFTDDMMVVEFGDDGATIPIAASPRLRDATPEQRNNFTIIGRGLGVHWPDVDEDLSAQGLFAYASKIESDPATQSTKKCCHALPPSLHEFSCRAWRP